MNPTRPESQPILTLHQISDPGKKDKNAEVIPAVEKHATEKGGIFNGLDFKIGRTAYKFKINGRIQTRFDYINFNNPGVENVHKLYFRRIRLKSDGFLFTPNLCYKLEFDLLSLKLLDLVFKWNLSRNFSIWAGQTKLHGNRERLISSQKLQLVDRSLLNAKFTLDRDIGVWFIHDSQYGNVVLREIFSITKGEGTDLIYSDDEHVFSGLDYTMRLEILPFGYFTNHGDYIQSDLIREKKPKLALGFTFDFNNNAIKSNGQKGKILNQHANLRSFMADAMFKYNGFSWMIEYVNRNISYIFSPPHKFSDLIFKEYYTGNAFNSQIGYLFQNNFEIATRYTYLNPMKYTEYKDISEYTIGFSKYISGHRIKIQTDFSLIKEEVNENYFRCRMQVELGI